MGQCHIPPQIKFDEGFGDLFGRHGWVLFTQPSNSPLTNVCDAALFPSLGKDCAALQGLKNGRHYLKPDLLWNILEKAWYEYSCETIAPIFVHHAQVVAAIYECESGDEFVQERKGLSFGVRHVSQPYYGDDHVGGYAGLDLGSLAPRDLGDAGGVMVTEVQTGVDVNSDAVRKLKYPLSDKEQMDQRDIKDYLLFLELDIIASNPDDVDYDNLMEEEKERYNKFAEAWLFHLEKDTHVYTTRQLAIVIPPNNVDPIAGKLV